MAALTNPCELPGSTLVAEQDDHLALVDPVTGDVRRSGVSPRMARFVTDAREQLDGLAFPRWIVDRSSDDSGRSIRVIDSLSGQTVFDGRFEWRIELATSAISRSGRFAVYVQSNNVASEVTILDAGDVSRRFTTIAHDAPLAAYAIGIVFSPDESCAALSMESIGGDGAETWLVDLATGTVTSIPAPDIFAIAWIDQ